MNSAWRYHVRAAGPISKKRWKKKNWEIPDNVIYVHYSSSDGNHDIGTSLLACARFGAVWGEGRGRHGQSYGIVVRDEEGHPVSRGEIVEQLVEMFAYFDTKIEQVYIPIPDVASGESKWDHREMSKFFMDAVSERDLPTKLCLDKTWYNLCEWEGLLSAHAQPKGLKWDEYFEELKRLQARQQQQQHEANKWQQIFYPQPGTITWGSTADPNNTYTYTGTTTNATQNPDMSAGYVKIRFGP